jgi:hypothetical protein
MTCQTSLTDEGTRAEQPNCSFLSLFRQHDEFDMALLDIEDRVAFGALPEDAGFGFVAEMVRQGPTVVRNTSGSNSWGETISPVLFLAALLPSTFFENDLLQRPGVRADQGRALPPVRSLQGRPRTGRALAA